MDFSGPTGKHFLEYNISSYTDADLLFGAALYSFDDTRTRIAATIDKNALRKVRGRALFLLHGHIRSIQRVTGCSSSFLGQSIHRCRPLHNHVFTTSRRQLWGPLCACSIHSILIVYHLGRTASTRAAGVGRSRDLVKDVQPITETMRSDDQLDRVGGAASAPTGPTAAAPASLAPARASTWISHTPKTQHGAVALPPSLTPGMVFGVERSRSERPACPGRSASLALPIQNRWKWLVPRSERGRLHPVVRPSNRLFYW